MVKIGVFNIFEHFPESAFRPKFSKNFFLTFSWKIFFSKFFFRLLTLTDYYLPTAKMVKIGVFNNF